MRMIQAGKLGLIILLVFGLAYMAILLINPQLGPTDDFVFLRTLQAGQPLLYYSADFPYYNSYEIGRFTPLVATEYNIYNFFSKSSSPFWYYFSHALQLVIFMILAVKIFSLFLPSKKLAYLITALISLTPGFTFTWFRLQLNERDMLVALALFLWCYFAYLQKPKIGYLLAGLAAANIAIYYKETAFIVMGAFALSHLILSGKKLEKRIKVFDLLLLLSAFIYFALYVIFFLPYGGIFVYGSNGQPFDLGGILRSFFNYATVSDPIIMLIVLPLALWRFYQILTKRLQSEPLYDSLLFASFVYVSTFFILRLSGVYYFLPLYILSLPAVFYFFKQPINKVAPWKILSRLALFFLIVNSIPLGLHYLTYYKYLPINFNRTLNFIVAEVKAKKSARPVNIFFAGLNKGSGNWNYFIISEFLLAQGLSPAQFDLKAEVEDEKKSKTQPLPLAIPKISLPYGVFQDNGPALVQSGDYLVVSPHSTDFAKTNGNRQYLASLITDYRLVFQTQSLFEFPQVTLKELGRLILSAGAHPQQKFLGLISRKKPNWDSPDYYVFIKK